MMEPSEIQAQSQALNKQIQEIESTLRQKQIQLKQLETAGALLKNPPVESGKKPNPEALSKAIDNYNAETKKLDTAIRNLEIDRVRLLCDNAKITNEYKPVEQEKEKIKMQLDKQRTILEAEHAFKHSKEKFESSRSYKMLTVQMVIVDQSLEKKNNAEQSLTTAPRKA